MRSVAHISDLHFGKTEAVVLDGLRAALFEAKPDIVVVFGADHVYKMNVRQMVDYHVQKNAVVVLQGASMALVDTPPSYRAAGA